MTPTGNPRESEIEDAAGLTEKTSAERLRQRFNRRNPVRVYERGIERSVRLTALKTTDRANAKQRRLDVRAARQTLHASLRARFSPPTRHRRSSPLRLLIPTLRGPRRHSYPSFKGLELARVETGRPRIHKSPFG